MCNRNIVRAILLMTALCSSHSSLGTRVEKPAALGVKAIAAGGGHSLALASDGTVWAWGYNNSGRLGDGTTTSRLTPIQVSGLTGIVGVAGGGEHSLAVKGDGTVWAWGDNYLGQLGDGTTTGRLTPVSVRGLTGVVWVTAGEYHNLAVRGDGTVWAWGNNYGGQLGDGTTTGRTTPLQVSGLSGVAAIAAGAFHSLALKRDGTVWAWGSNYSGQLGDGTQTARSTPVQVKGLSSVVVMAAGAGRSLAVKGDGTIWGWGYVEYTPWLRPTPGRVVELTGVLAVAGGRAHSLALKQDGTVWAWGDNQIGQLGDGTFTSRLTPVQTIGLTGIVAAVAGDHGNLALDRDGTVWEWGYRATPSHRTEPTGVVAIASGQGAVPFLFWLSNAMGRSGRGEAMWAMSSPLLGTRGNPAQVSGLTEVVAVAAGADHCLALKGDGTVWAWGSNHGGELGDGTQTRQLTPVQVKGLSGVAVVAASPGYSLAAKSDGTVWAWGYNSHGQLGDGTTTHRTLPVQVSGLTGVVAIAAGGTHGLALKGDGMVWGWGAMGQLGDGTPVQVSGLTGVVAIAAGAFHSLAVKRDGTVWAWGVNEHGQLGDGTRVRTSPVQAVSPGSPDLVIRKSHTGHFTVGAEGVYTLTITNTGPSATAGTVTVTDTLPAGLAYVSGTGSGWTCSAAGQTVTCTSPGPVNPGASSTIALTVSVGPSAYPGVTNLATLSNGSDLNFSNNVAGDPTVVLLGPVKVNGVVNAASFRSGAVAPGEIVSVFGNGIGWPDGVSGRLNAQGLFENTLGQTRVLFDGLAAPMIFARADQVTAVAPYALAGKRSTEVQVEYRGVKSSPQTLAVAASAPGIFTAASAGSGQGAIFNEDGSLNSGSNPARRGSIIVLFATGEGQTSPSGVDGKVAAAPFPRPLLPVSVQIGGQEADVLYAGCAPGLVAGVLQVNARVPAGVSAGVAVPVVLTVGQAQSQPGVTLAIQ